MTFKKYISLTIAISLRNNDYFKLLCKFDHYFKGTIPKLMTIYLFTNQEFTKRYTSTHEQRHDCTNKACGFPQALPKISYEKSGFNASASSSFCACASARSFPNVVKYVLIFGSVPDGRTIACAPPSKSYVNTIAAGSPVSSGF